MLENHFPFQFHSAKFELLILNSYIIYLVHYLTEKAGSFPPAIDGGGPDDQLDLRDLSIPGCSTTAPFSTLLVVHCFVLEVITIILY